MYNRHKNNPRAIMLVKFKGPYCNKIQRKCVLLITVNCDGPNENRKL